MKEMKPGLVGGKPSALFLHAAERTHGDPAIGFAAPRAAPMLEPNELLGRFSYEGLHRVLIAEPVAARDGVVGVLIKAVAPRDHPRGSTLRRDGVTPHGIDLGNNCNAERWIGFSDGDRGAKSCATAADEDHVMSGVHALYRRSGLVDEELAIVAHNPSTDAAIVVFVLNALAPTRVHGFPRYDTLVIMIFVVLTSDESAAGGPLRCEAAVRSHRRLPSIPM